MLTDGTLDYLKTRIQLGPRETRKLTFTGGAEAITTALVITPDSGYASAADASKLQEISVGSDFSRFFNELFEGVPPDFIGSVVAESSEDFYLVVLRLETRAAGFELTSVPASSGK